MLELYKSEMQRLGKGTAIGLLVLFVGYYAAPRFALWEILHRNMGFILTVGAIGLSLCFGILHGILWRKKNFWIFLIHRPLKPARIYTSLLGAGVTVILGTLFLSLFITTLNYDLFTDKVVDTRHYLFAIYTALLSIACYMIGTLTVLHRSKFVFLAFYPLALTFFPEPQNAVTQYLPLLGFLAALFYLNLQCFKADLNKPIKSALGTGLLASATSYGLVIGLIMLTMVIYHVPLMLMGQHPDANPQDGSMKAMWLDNGENAIAYLLEESDHPRASHYALQATMAERRSVPTRGWKAPRRHQLHRFDNADAIYNPEQGDVWKFSHDEMLLIGTSALTGKSIGAIGLNGPLTDVSIATPSDRF